MRHINVYRNVDTNEPMEVPLHFQFYFYYYRPYVLLDDLRNLDPNCVGLLALNKQNEKISQSRDDERIYLHEKDHVPVEDAIYLLHYLTGNFDFLIDIDENNV